PRRAREALLPWAGWRRLCGARQGSPAGGSGRARRAADLEHPKAKSVAGEDRLSVQLRVSKEKQNSLLECISMRREYHKWFTGELNREMEMLVFGHDGLPAIVFPTSQGRFYEFEDRGMVGAVADKIEAGRLQLFCVDSVDGESWYNRNVGPDW